MSWESEAVASAQNKYFKLEVFYDPDRGSPREYDNLGTFLTWDRGYNSPDDNPYSEPGTFMREWLPTEASKCPSCGNDGVTPMRTESQDADAPGTVSAITIAEDEDPPIYECGWCGDAWCPSPGMGAGGVLLPVFKFEHGGVAFRTSAFSDPWDSGQVGFIYATAEDIAENFPGFDTTDKWVTTYHPGAKTVEEVAAGVLKAEVDTYSSWANGECFGYVLSEWKGCYDGEDRYEEVDSCWGFIGEINGEGGWGSCIDGAADPHVAELIAKVGWI